MANKPLCGVDTINSVTANDKIFVNVNGTIKQSKVSDMPAMKDLDELKVGEYCGGKNLQNVNSIAVKKDNVYITDYLLPIGTYTISFISDTNGVIDFFSKELSGGVSGGGSCSIKANQRVSKTFTVNSPTRLCSYSSVTATLTEIQIEKGTTATPYEPYIPSVKMIADGINAQNNSLEDYGLNNKFANDLRQGAVASNGEYVILTYSVCNTNPISCANGDLITLKTETDRRVNIRWFNESTFLSAESSIAMTDSGVSFKAPTNATNFYYNIIGGCSTDKDITPSTVGKISVYINNAIDDINNSLSNMKKLCCRNLTLTMDENGCGAFGVSSGITLENFVSVISKSLNVYVCPIFGWNGSSLGIKAKAWNDDNVRNANVDVTVYYWEY